MNGKFAFVIKAALVAVLALLVFRVLDILMARQIYSWIFQPIYEQGVPEQIAGIIAVWLTAAIVVLGPTILLDLFLPALFPEWLRNYLWKNKRHYRRGVNLTALGLTIWSVLMFVIARPGDGELFNKITGKPWYGYSFDAKGEVVLFPKGVRFNPASGEPVKELTADAAKKLAKEHPRVFRTSVLLKLGDLDIGFDPPLQFPRADAVASLGFERIKLTKNETELFFAASMGKTDSGYGELEPVEDAYLTDERGKVSRLTADKGEYEREFGWFIRPDRHSRKIRPTEVYRYSVTFEPVDRTSKAIRFFQASAPPILIDLEQGVATLVPVPRSTWDPEGYAEEQRAKRETEEAARLQAESAVQAEAERRARAIAFEEAEKARLLQQAAAENARAIAQAKAAEQAEVEAKLQAAEMAYARAEGEYNNELSRYMNGPLALPRLTSEGISFTPTLSSVPVKVAEAKRDAAKRALDEARAAKRALSGGE